MNEFYKALCSILKKENGCLCEEPMSRHTTFRVGGPAQYYVSVSDTGELSSVLALCKEYAVPVTVLGNGSNVLVSDRGIRGVVLHLSGTFSEMSVEENQAEGEALVRVGAGMMLSAFAMRVAKMGYAGTAFAAGIPGTIGGAVLMNAGAYGGEIKDAIVSADFMTMDGNLQTFLAEDLQLSYRFSRFQQMEGIITGATFRFAKGDAVEQLAQIEELGRKRKDKQPLEFPSAGSTFKRPEGYFAGKLIQDAGLSGYRVGDAEVSTKHCGFVINRGNATADDVYRLILDVIQKVENEFGVRLEPEVRLLGEFGNAEA